MKYVGQAHSQILLDVAYELPNQVECTCNILTFDHSIWHCDLELYLLNRYHVSYVARCHMYAYTFLEFMPFMGFKGYDCCAIYFFFYLTRKWVWKCTDHNALHVMHSSIRSFHVIAVRICIHLRIPVRRILFFPNPYPILTIPHLDQWFKPCILQASQWCAQKEEAS